MLFRTMFSITKHSPKSGRCVLLALTFRITMIPLVHALGWHLGLCLALLNPFLKYVLFAVLSPITSGNTLLFYCENIALLLQAMLHFDCRRVAVLSRHYLATISQVSRQYLASISPVSRFDLDFISSLSSFYPIFVAKVSRFYPGFIAILQLHCNKSAILLHLKCN